MTSLRSLTPILRRRHLLLGLWAALCFLTRGTVNGGDWHYFVSGSDLLFGRHPPGMPAPGGLHLYANYPELQIGPLGLVGAGFFRLIGFGHGHLVAQIVMCALGPLLVLVVERAAVAARGLQSVFDEPLLPLAVLLGGAVFLRSWTDVAGPIAHVDDVLALAAAVVAVWGVANGRPVLTGLAVGVAIAAKPWGILALPLVLALGRRGAFRSFTIALVTAAAAWLPFAIADPFSVASAGRFTISTRADSALHVLGIHAPEAPGWLRSTQMVLGMTVALVAVARGRWGGALLAAFAVRIGLDPAAWPYYTPELVLAALVLDLVGSRRPLPVWTLISYAGLASAGAILAAPGARGVDRLAVAAAALVAATLVPRRRGLVEARA